MSKGNSRFLNQKLGKRTSRRLRLSKTALSTKSASRRTSGARPQRARSKQSKNG